ncbi:uncharacterized protein [Gossypium hirsutum]|uniref:Retrotransposon gag domain-containing protein n=1 Tax=Gossypium hirsutum TaxID=3635 RepID=A0ABM3BJD5_GOSHI|nr:uncharacterized protein LOC107917414 [Gossypium hirsutum]
MALDITGNNYLSWVLDAEIHLDAKGLGETIKEGNEESTQDKAKAMIFLRHHLHEGLKTEYLTIKDPQILWANLKEIYDHQKTVILPKARYEWLNLRLQDFKSVSDYNSAMFRITSQLNFCGEKITDAEMLEKTHSTFHANNVVLQTQYREKGFQKYSKLISFLLVAEQNNELLMKNHELRPTGFAPSPEANKWDRKNGNKEEKEKGENVTNVCYCCGGKGHWSCVCHTQKHLVDLYQQSIKQKGKKVETNLVYKNGEGDFDDGNATHLEVADFLSTPEGNY